MIDATACASRAIFGVVLCLSSLVSHAAEPTFGIAINSSVDGESPIRLVPSGTLRLGKSQFELGFGLHPFIRSEQRVFSGEFNYKYYPNGTEQLFSSYLLGRFSYVNVARETFYPTTYHYLISNVGYGLRLQRDSPVYAETNVSVGPYTYLRRTENPYEGFESNGLFDDVGLNLAFQFNVGLHF